MFEKYAASPSELKHSIDDLRQNEPAPMSSVYDAVDKAEAVRDWETRFAQNTLV